MEKLIVLKIKKEVSKVKWMLWASLKRKFYPSGIRMKKRLSWLLRQPLLILFYDPPAFRGAETLFPFLADEIFLFTIKDEPFACIPPPLLLLTNPDVAAFFGVFVFALFEFDLDIYLFFFADNFSKRTSERHNTRRHMHSSLITKNTKHKFFLLRLCIFPLQFFSLNSSLVSSRRFQCSILSAIIQIF